MTSASGLVRVIGLVGHKAAGKDELCRRLAGAGYGSLRLSDPIRAEAERRGFANYTVQQLMDIGNEGRAKGGPGYWATKALELAMERGIAKLIVNGVRNPGEIESLAKGASGKFTLAGITAPILVRYARVEKRGQVEDRSELEAFLAMDDRDRGIGEPADGQQVDRCIAMVPHDRLYNNAGSLEDYHAWIDAFRAKIEADSGWRGEFGGGE